MIKDHSSSVYYLRSKLRTGYTKRIILTEREVLRGNARDSHSVGPGSNPVAGQPG